MTRWLAAGLLFLGWHFATTFFVPAGGAQARGWVIWPFGHQSRPPLSAIRGVLAPRAVPSEPAPTLALVLAAVASIGFLIALAALFGIVVPVDWWRPAVVVSSAASVVLFVMYLSPWALIPLLVDAVLLWGVLLRGWSVQGMAAI
jgi:hypothetical protein